MSGYGVGRWGVGAEGRVGTGLGNRMKGGQGMNEQAHGRGGGGGGEGVGQLKF